MCSRYSCLVVRLFSTTSLFLEKSCLKFPQNPDYQRRKMSSKHLSIGSKCPPLAEGKQRLYVMRYCPFAQRALLAAEAKSIPYDVVYVDLTNKPEWLLQKNPRGAVPVLETSDGKILYESLIVADYLDEAFPSLRPLHPTDPYEKAVDRIYLEKYGSVVSLFYKVMFAISGKEDDSSKLEKFKAFVHGLEPFELELKRRNTIYFGGNEQPMMLDYMMWPWFERIPMLTSTVNKLFDNVCGMAKKENPMLERWKQSMKKDKTVAKLEQPRERYVAFMEGFINGNPKYD